MPIPRAALADETRLVVACFGLLLRDSEYKGRAGYDLVLSLARGAQGRDIGEYRRGFLDLVEECKKLAK